ncbi:type II toxin-antitoxin system VapB family antitoxin [Catellatospora sp. NPDC049133]|jgi:Arc/MetJ family transcription regulator|uniref:type II toxin-antitoxin system VapB family antitoxin n=1 Tax=Catellatospora sp. NPDC049133 TaxID=3155499 RepID=UPI0033C3DFC1
MSRTMIDLDDELLAEAARLLGTETKKDTVNAALREVAARLRRIEALRELQTMTARGEIDADAWEARHLADKQAG